jgi:hypothetical protein
MDQARTVAPDYMLLKGTLLENLILKSEEIRRKRIFLGLHHFSFLPFPHLYFKPSGQYRSNLDNSHVPDAL